MKRQYLSIAFHTTVFTVLLSAFAYVGLVWYFGTLPGEGGKAAHLTANEEVIKTWNYQNGGNEFRQFDMQWDGSGKPMISYISDTRPEGSPVYTLNFVEYIGNAEGDCEPGSNWRCERIVSGSGTSSNSRIGLDKDNRPIVTFKRSTAALFTVAEYVGNGMGNCEAGSNWKCTEVPRSPQGTSSMNFSSIKRTMSGNPMIAYTTKDPLSVSLAEYVGNGNGNCLPGSDWSCTIIDSDPSFVFRHVSLAIDANGKPIIGYSKEGSPLAIKMARHIGQGGNCGNGIWSCEEVQNSTGEENSPMSYMSLSADLDTSGQPVMGYIVAISSDEGSDYYNLKYISYAGGGGTCTNTQWRCETIENLGYSSGGQKTMKNPITMDTSVGYSRKVRGISGMSIKYAEYVGGGTGNCSLGSNWNCEALIGNTHIPAETKFQMELDPQGLPVFLYLRQIPLPPEEGQYQWQLIYATSTGEVTQPHQVPQMESVARRVPESAAPPQPITSLASSLEGTTIKLSWQDPPSHTLDHIEILRNYNPLPDVVTGDAYAVAEKKQEVFTDSNLVLGNTYKYIVRSVNGYGSYVNSEEIAIEVKEEKIVEEEVKEEEVVAEEGVGGEEIAELPPVEEEPQGALAVSAVYKAAGIPDVYYIASNEKRYVFPDEDVYKSWYRSFDAVKEVDVRELAFYPLAGIVTYRPGLQLIKIATEPKVYVLEKGGMLRWIVNEEIASELFGRTWSDRIVVVDAALFVHYRRGKDIETTADYSIPEGVSEAGCGEGETALTGTCALVEQEGIPSEAPVVFAPTLEKEGIAPVSVTPTSSVFLWLVRLLTIVLFIVIFSVKIYSKRTLSFPRKN